MKKMVKMLSVVMVIVIMATIMVLPASAAGYSNNASVRSSSTFNSEWEKTRTYKVGSDTIGTMIYGYDTDWINEDYVWTKATECHSTAMVYRDGYDADWSYCAGPEKGRNTYSKIEVTHRTYYVYYKMKFSASYSNVSYTTATSSVK